MNNYVRNDSCYELCLAEKEDDDMPATFEFQSPSVEETVLISNSAMMSDIHAQDCSLSQTVEILISSLQINHMVIFELLMELPILVKRP